jgi:virginiamycin B lyase
VTASPNGPTTINLTLSGIVAALALALDPATLPSGSAANTAIILNALDPDGNIIVGPQPFADANGNALTVTLSDSDASGATSLPAQHTFTAPTGDVALHYTGAVITGATITASAPGVTSKTATLTIGTSSAFVTEFHAGIASGSGAAGIALGPDGNLWFTELFGDRIGRISPHGVVREFSAGITPFSRASSMAAGPDGNMWFTENAGRIGRITPGGAITEFSAGIPSGARPAGIAAGSDGNVWFTDESALRVGRITPAGVVTMFTAGITVKAVSAFLAPCSAAKGPNGNVWWLEQDLSMAGIPQIAQITPAGVVTEYPLTLAIVAGVAPGPDGNVWFTEGSNIDRITPAGTVTRFAQPVATSIGTGCIALGPDNNLWFTGEFADGVGKSTPSGTITTYSTGFGITSLSTPVGIAPGSDGNVWFTEQTGDGVGRVNIR